LTMPAGRTMIIVRAKHERLFYCDTKNHLEAIDEVKKFYHLKKADEILIFVAVQEYTPEAIDRFWNWAYQEASPIPVRRDPLAPGAVTISETIADLLQSLPDRHRELVIKYLGLVDNQPQRKVDIANELGISRARVSQIINKAWWMIYQVAERRAKLDRFIA